MEPLIQPSPERFVGQEVEDTQSLHSALASTPKRSILGSGKRPKRPAITENQLENCE